MRGPMHLLLQKQQQRHCWNAASRSVRSLSSFSTNETEVEKFSAMNSTWWDPQKNPLIHMNVVRVNYICNQVQKAELMSAGSSTLRQTQQLNTPVLDGIRALDVGCGGGLLSESLARLGATVTAIDPSEALIQVAQSHANTDRKVAERINYVGGMTVEELSMQEKESYDIVCLLEVVEHVPNVPSFVQAACNLVQPGGLLFVSTINRTWKSYALTIVGAEYIMRYLPVGTHDWNKYLSPQEMKTIVEAESTMKQIDASGMVLKSPPVWNSWDWRIDPNDTDINWIGTYQKLKK